MLVGSNFNFSLSAIENILSAGQNTDTHPISTSSVSPAVNSLTDGTGIDKAQKAGRLQLTLSTSPTDVDLTAFAGGINGTTINFSKVKWFSIRNLDLVNGVTIGGTAGAPANAWTNFINGTKLLNKLALWGEADNQVGWTVAGANKLLRMVAIAGTPIVEICFVGEGA